MGAKATACLAVVVALCGCGTVVNCVNYNGAAPREIYGGVKQDVINGKTHLDEAFHGPAPCFSAMPQPPNLGRDFVAKTFCAGCGLGMLAVDLPVSAVADTLTLPVTVASTILKSDKKTPNRKAKAMQMPSAALPSNTK